jgi:hypothetical protein
MEAPKDTCSGTYLKMENIKEDSTTLPTVCLKLNCQEMTISHLDWFDWLSAGSVSIHNGTTTLGQCTSNSPFTGGVASWAGHWDDSANLANDFNAW